MVGCERMPRIDQLDQSRGIDMGINLGRRDIGMPKQGLQHAKVGTARKQMRRKGVAKHVWADSIRGNPG